MITPAQAAFLEKSYAAGRASTHPFPEFAACETALESAWGTDRLVREANNLFGQKRDPTIPLDQCIYCDTQEEDAHGHWYTEHNVPWPMFASWTACYDARLALLKRLAGKYPATYGAALEAKTGELFITLVSRTWSTWTGRAAAALAIYHSHRDLLGGPGGAVK
ncbi:MAG TPA: glucosaminidase domain-containing protein [Bryobacteraceae bacterium]|nr:glucosaminidase domain-containing protein [Bryobacteraceae bacterium]